MTEKIFIIAVLYMAFSFVFGVFVGKMIKRGQERE